jgi:5-methyltetrahydrofolate--homocysteine methyltransferase
MSTPRFIAIGENIHCTRIYKVGGAFVKKTDAGADAIVYAAAGATRHLPIPERFTKNADWEAGKVKHCAVAIWQGMHGADADRLTAIEYLQALARKQESAGAAFLDVNVDEYTTEVPEKLAAIRWLCEKVQRASKIPLSIDSSNPDLLRAGLDACDKALGRAMINSVSLERPDAIRLAAEYNAAVVASASGEKGLPNSLEERLANVARLMPLLRAAGIPDDAIYIDPLVFPVATDSANGLSFLHSVTALRTTYGKDIHISGGLSNISFGLPNRKLINQVFTWLAVEAGADSGIVDPLQINARVLAELDTKSEPFRLAKNLLTGEDAFGGEFIMAHREGRLGKE